MLSNNLFTRKLSSTIRIFMGSAHDKKYVKH